MSAVLPHLSQAPIEKVTLGFRPLPKDSHPIVGFPDGRRDIYISVMHSGITLGPLIGLLAAMEILDGVRVDPLAPYRLERLVVNSGATSKSGRTPFSPGPLRKRGSTPFHDSRSAAPGGPI